VLGVEAKSIGRQIALQQEAERKEKVGNAFQTVHSKGTQARCLQKYLGGKKTYVAWGKRKKRGVEPRLRQNFHMTMKKTHQS